jgi:hypothetical protein
MSEKKKPDENLAGDKMDVNAAEQIIAGAKQALYNEEYTNLDEDAEDRDTRENEELEDK